MIFTFSLGVDSRTAAVRVAVDRRLIRLA